MLLHRYLESWLGALNLRHEIDTARLSALQVEKACNTSKAPSHVLFQCLLSDRLEARCNCSAGVGADLAEAILGVYPTPLSLKTAYEAAMKGAPQGQAVTAAQRLLEGIRVSPARKIGAQQSGRVFDTLFAAGWHCV